MHDRWSYSDSDKDDQVSISRGNAARALNRRGLKVDCVTKEGVLRGYTVILTANEPLRFSKPGGPTDIVVFSSACERALQVVPQDRGPGRIKRPGCNGLERVFRKLLA